MDDLKPDHWITTDHKLNEIHFMISGFWPLDQITAFVTELDEAANPLFGPGKTVRALGDMGGFKPQNRETGQAIERQVQYAAKYGLEKIAILNASPLVKSQYKRLSAGINVEFFGERLDALGWLRE